MSANYQGVCNSDLAQLIKEVNIMAARGWIPLGPPLFYHPNTSVDQQGYVVYMWKPPTPAILIDSGRSVH